MSTLVFNVSWPTFAAAILLFGFAPGAVLRLIVLAFTRDDPRRQELLAELHVVPRVDRPFWVAEQLEIALFEGLRGRIVSRRIQRKPRQVRQNKVIVGATPMTLVTPAGVLAAIKASDKLGRDEFLRSTGFGRARRCYLEHDGQLYDAKAIVGYAHGINSGAPLRPSDFSAYSAVRCLESLGFTISQASAA